MGFEENNCTMKAFSLKEIKTELGHRHPTELVDLCLRLARFKKENKELLTYLLIAADNEAGYIESVKSEIDELFTQINTRSFYFINKSVRKILSTVKKYERYTVHKTTEVELHIYFLLKMRRFTPSLFKSPRLRNLYSTEFAQLQKKLTALHPDLQVEYSDGIDKL